VRILFVKTSSLGDVIHNCPAVSDAKRAHPGVAIDWVVEEPFAAIAAMHGAVRRVIPVALRRWRRALWDRGVWTQFATFRRALSAERYDVVLDTQGLLKSALLARLAGGAHHGYAAASAREPLAALFYRHRHAVPRERHAVERNRELTAAALGYRFASDSEYGLTAVRRGDGGALGGAAPHGASCVLLTMTSRADKLWAESSWIALGQALSRRGLQCVLPHGDEAEAARARRIASEVPGAIVPPHLPLDGLAALMRSARAVVGLDTGLTHLAAALDTPAVGIYCGSDPRLTGLYGGRRAVNLGAPGAPPRPEDVGAALEPLWR
jgi:heptosyltransferase-1